MDATITLEFAKPDALALLGAVEDTALSWSIHAAYSTGEEKEYALFRAKSLRAQARRITDALYPETEAEAAA